MRPHMPLQQRRSVEGLQADLTGKHVLDAIPGGQEDVVVADPGGSLVQFHQVAIQTGKKFYIEKHFWVPISR